MTTLREINDLKYEICMHGNDPPLEMQLAGKKQELLEQKAHLPTPEQLDELSLTCGDDIFLEVLMGAIRSSLISFQSWVRKLSTLKKNSLIVRINSLRDNFIVNSGNISDLQAKLNELIEAEIKEKIKAMKLFEGLHSEKPSPIFLSLAKSKNKGNLDHIKDDTGTPFRTDQEKGEYIARFFEKLYKIPEGDPILAANCIEDYLGEDICNSNVVRNSRLTEPEKLTSEAPLTLLELDNSLGKANMKSAPGMDGFSNVLIKKCWNYLRRPLLKYSQCCYNSGSLTPNFRGANI